MSTRPTCALPLLCLVQGCERFAFFAVLPLFVLYMQRHVGMPEHSALVLLGVFLSLSYLACLLGGAIADRWLGSFRATLLGCALLASGYGALALDRPALLGLALLLQAAGHGLFKPGISVCTGALYQAGDRRRERSFLILHVAVNVGGMAGPLCGEWSRGHSWSAIFRWAAASMALAIVALLLGSRYIVPKPDQRPATNAEPIDAPAVRERIRAIRLFCALGVVFWLTAQQAGTSLALFAESHTRPVLSLTHRPMTLGPGHFASLHSLLVLVLLPPMLLVFAGLRRRGREPAVLAKMIWGYIFTAAAFALMGLAGLRGGDGGSVSPAWLTGCYALLSVAELLLAPMSMALVSQLAPPDQTSRMVGLWLAATAVGNALTGALGLLWGRWSNHRYFGLLALVSLGGAVGLLLRHRHLHRLLSVTAGVHQNDLPKRP